MDERERNRPGSRDSEPYRHTYPVSEKRKTNWFLPVVLGALLLFTGIWVWSHRRENTEIQRSSAVRGGYETEHRSQSGTISTPGVTPMNLKELAATKTVETVRVDENLIRNMKTGQNTNFYVSEMKGKGYMVAPIHQMPDHTTYLVRGQREINGVRQASDGGVLVTLHTDDQSNPGRVSQVETAHAQQGLVCQPIMIQQAKK